jgi:hypothetical protein
MGTIIKFNLSRGTNAKALALNSRSKDAINSTLLKTESLSNISSGDLFTINTL